MKNLTTFNASLLAKWQWRFLSEKDALCTCYLYSHSRVVDAISIVLVNVDVLYTCVHDF